MAKKKTQSKTAPQTKKKGASVQDLIGIKTFTDYGIVTNRGELLFYLVTPTNISVLSAANSQSRPNILRTAFIYLFFGAARNKYAAYTVRYSVITFGAYLYLMHFF